MLKIIISAVWICLVTLGAAYGAAVWKSGQQVDSKPDEFFGGLDYIKSSIISVPIISGGKVHGYVIAQFVYTVESAVLKKLTVPPEPFLIDEAFRTLYTGEAIDFKNMKKYDIAGLKQKISDNINARFGEKIVHDVLVEQFNYVPSDKVRYGADSVR